MASKIPASLLGSIKSLIQSTLGISKTVTLSNIAVNAAANAPHGFGSRPESMQVFLECVIAEQSWAVGDLIPWAQADNATTMSHTFGFNTTNFIIVPSGSLRINNQSTTAAVNITTANWRWRIIFRGN